MTVGVAAITGHGTDSAKVLLGADRMLTTRQLSAIEHEHPESKLSRLGEQLPATNLQCVVSGSIPLGQDLKTKIESRIVREANERGPMAIGVQHVASWAAEEYRNLVQEKIENVVLSSYGLELEDLSRQHQFKDGFFDAIVSEVEGVENHINENLRMLLGGVDSTGTYIYGISKNNQTAHANPGYATIGSGKQPAESEFIKANYSKSWDFEEGIAVCGAALYEAQEASGVGGLVDIGVIGAETNKPVDRSRVTKLMDREEIIAEKQEDLRDDHIEENPIDWGGH